MQAVGRLGSYISQGVYTVSGPFHPFGGAVDIVVIEQQDGSFKSSPWYVRFGKFQGVLKAKEKVVQISVNGVPTDFQMYLDHKGEAFFLTEIDPQEANLTSPSFPSPPHDTNDISHSLRSKSCNFDANDGTKIVGRTSSAQRSRILGLVFGRRSMKRGDVDVDGEGEGEGHGNGIGIGNRAGSLERAEIAADLLDLNWTTNLSRENASRVSGDRDIVSENGDLNENGEACFDGVCDSYGKEVVYDGAGSDIQVACLEVKVQEGLEKQLNGEEVSAGLSTVDATGSNSNTNSNSSNNNNMNISEVDVSFSSEQAREVLYFAEGGCGEVHVSVHNEVLHGATVLLSEDIKPDEVIENADVGMPVLEVFESEFHSVVQQMNCSDSNDSMYNEVHVQEKTTSTKPQTGVGLGVCSSETAELNDDTKPPSYSSLNDQASDEHNMEDKDVSHTLLSPLDSPRKESRRSPSPSSKDEIFLFGDLDESGKNDQYQYERSFSPEHVDKEDHISHENSNEKLTEKSIPIAIPRKNEAAGEEVGQHTGSLPNISASSNSMAKHKVCYPLSQSLDSKSLPWEFPGNNDFKYPESDEDKGNHLSREEADAKGNLDSGASKVYQVKENQIEDPSTKNPSSGGNWRIWPFSLRKAESRNPMLPPTPSDAKSTSFANSPDNTISPDVNKNEVKRDIKKKKKVKQTTPTSEQLASLNLKDGMNTVIFTFSTPVLGVQQVDARIYLWKWNARIVISDVDGTITRSDVLGQFMPLVGIDWSQTGVAHLFSAIKENGYKLLFLSARSISQAYLTRQFLLNLKQDGKVLPDGPVVISPDGLFPSLYREVIKRVPHEFKIACLEDIKALFPPDCNPFYAGFGNRDSDEISYLKVGIPIGKIFIINPRGEIVVNRRLDTKSYTSMHALVNGMFPPTNSSEQEDFNQWNYWKLSPPAIDI